MEALKSRVPDLKFMPLAAPSSHPHYLYDPFNPSTQVLSAGHTKAPGRRPFPVDTVFEKDAAVDMRDNVKLYTDVFRPKTSDESSGKVPALIQWSPYGKSGGKKSPSE
jgi:uncharacterized protein